MLGLDSQRKTLSNLYDMDQIVVTISKLFLVLMYVYRNINSLTEIYAEIILMFLHSNVAYVIM